MAEVARHPAFISTWIALLAVVALCGSVLLWTPVGRQALVDERVRAIEALGGRVDDGAYAALQAHPPRLAYATSGGRLLLNPGVTLLVALGLVVLGALDGTQVRYLVALAVSVHATVVLAVQQVLLTPVHYVRESLTSPTTLAGLLPMVEEGTWVARLLGAVDVFGLWWVWLLAVGMAAATGRPTGRYLWRLGLAYAAVAALVAAVLVLAGGQGL